MTDDGEFGPTRQEVRDLNGLSSSDYSNDKVDVHLEQAFNRVQGVLKLTFATTTQTFTDLVFNSRDLTFDSTTSHGHRGYYTGYSYGDGYNNGPGHRGFGNNTILYFGDFLQDTNRLPLITITKVETKSQDSDSYQEQTEGQNDDYTIDLISNAIIFNHGLARDGYQNVRISGTFGVINDEMTSLSFKYKQYIALLAAIKGLTYASGGEFNNSKDITLGSTSTRVDEFSSTTSNTFDRLKEDLKDHIEAYGLATKRTVMQVA